MSRVTAFATGLSLIALISLGYYFLDESNPTQTAKAEVDQHDDHDDGPDPDDEHGDHGGHGDESEAHDEGEGEGPELVLSKESLDIADIRIERLEARVLIRTVLVPAEIRSNSYQSSVITPRIPAIVVERHARLSDVVETGAPLVTLFSRDVARAEGEFLVADREWRRVRSLGREVVSERRYLEAQVARTQAEALLLSYGLARAAIDAVVSRGNGAGHSPGEFTLLADQSGTLTSDNFRDGELIEPGQMLFEIVNLDTVWVEARVDASDAAGILSGGVAWVHLKEGTRKAVIEQVNTTIDEETRTIGVRLIAENADRELRPGLFVQAEIEAGEGRAVLAVPNDALVRSADGDWVLFVQGDDGGLKPVEVDRVKVTGEHTVIDGIPAGTRVAVSGAFFLHSELAKGGFDIHNH